MILFEHPFMIVLAVIFSLLLALFVYRKDGRFSAAPKSVRGLLFALRFTSLLILSLLLLKPKWLQESKKLEKPILVFLQDASASILNGPDSTYYSNELLKTIRLNNEKLSEDFELYSYHFDREMKEGLSKEFTGNSTDISKAFQSIENRFYHRNLAGVVLASDGNYNRGLNPYYKAPDLNAPIFTLALGDTTQKKDLRIASIRHNEIAYYGNEFPLQFDVLSNFNATEKHQLIISNKGKVVHEEWLELTSNTPITKKIYLQADQEGIQFYTLEIQSFEGEQNTENNKHEIAIDVLKNIQKTLILSSAPHPDVSALKSALQEGQNYKVSTALFHEFKEDIEPYNLIILHQIPDFTRRNPQLLSQILKSETALFFIGGGSTDWNAFNNIQDFAELKTAGQKQDVFPHINDSFSAFELSDKCKKFIDNSPPLLAPFAEVFVDEPKQSLFKQKIESITTDKELLVFKEVNGKQMALLLAEGLWKWRLYDYQKNQSHNNFNEWIQSISQYLTVNKDKRKLRLQYPKLIQEGAPFQMDAQLYNDNYKLIQKAALSLRLTDEDNKEYIYSLSPELSSYKTKLKNLPVGTYQLEVTSIHKDQKQSQKGVFTVMGANLENQKLSANWKLLAQMSKITGGTTIYKESFAQYAATIKKNTNAKTQVYYQQYLSDLIQQKGIFLVLLLSLFFEWALRKRLGTH